MKIRNFATPLFLSGLAVAPVFTAHAATISAVASGLSVNLDEKTGEYSVSAANTHWQFSGNLGAVPTLVKTVAGKDKLGEFREIQFRWRDDRVWNGSIRSYQSRPLISFGVGTARAAPGPTPDFPAFTKIPGSLHALSFQDSVFSPPTFKLVQTSTPWFLFDDVGQTAVLSPASDFLVSQMHGDGKTLFASGINAQVQQLPAGFKHTSFFVFDSGIAKTFHTWGDALTDLSGKPRTADNADDLIKYLGYWTDNGGFYYYNYDPTKGYTQTLADVRQHYRDAKIPIRYMQLDSWWYQKSLRNPNGSIGVAKNVDLPVGNWNAYGGTLNYSASPALFPNGLGAFNKQLDLPFAVHARWIDPTGPYRKTYQLSGVAPIDPKWWAERMAYLKNNGVITYEQDWLNEIYGNSPAMARDLKTGPAFTDGMAHSAQTQGITLQYCMATSRFFLQGSSYPNLTTIRTSEDRFERGKWNNFLYTSMLADALRIRPWTDVFKSTESGNLTIAALSSGPVGVGDEMGKESAPALLTTARADGVLIKTAAPLLPTDASILSDAREEKHPLVASTYTDNGQRVAYAFVYNRRDDATSFSFTPASLGLQGAVYAYDITAKTAKKLEAGDALTDKLGDQGWNAYLIAPLGASGIAFMGDVDKIVGTGRQRIASVHDEAGRLTATVTLAANEEAVTLHGYATTAPTVSSPEGEVSPVIYTAATHGFTVTVKPRSGATAKVVDGDPVRQITVVFQSR